MSATVFHTLCVGLEVRARIMAGEKSHLENAAYLPQLVVGKNANGEPIRANFMYAIKCHKVHQKLPKGPTHDLQRN